VIRWLGRLLLLRVLPRRIVPLLTVVEVVQLLRAARRQVAGSDATHRFDGSTAAPRGRRVVGRSDDDRWADAFTAHHDRTGASDRA
jgi:hypothetical protein